MPVNHVCERPQVHHVRRPPEIEHNATVGSVLGLLEQQKELKETALAGAVGAEETGHLAKGQIGFAPCLEVLDFHAVQHVYGSCPVL